MESSKDKQAQNIQKIKLFAMFLLIAVVSWLFMFISNEKTDRMVFKFKIEPNTVMFLSQNEWEGQATALVETSGIISSFKKTYPDVLTIKEAWVENIYGGTPYILLNNFLNEWQGAIVDIKLLRFEKDTLWIPVKRKTVKRIPVNVPVNIHFRSGYKWSHDPIVNPDSIEIVGNKVYLDAINEVFTDTLYYDGLDQNLRLTIPLESPFKEVFFKTQEVEFSGEVLKFTENTIDIPINLTVENPQYQVEIFPKIVKLTYQIPIEKFNEVTVNDFEVSCVISNEVLTNDQQNLLLPQLSKKPEWVNYYNIEPTEIRFIAYPSK